MQPPRLCGDRWHLAQTYASTMSSPSALGCTNAELPARRELAASRSTFAAGSADSTYVPPSTPWSAHAVARALRAFPSRDCSRIVRGGRGTRSSNAPEHARSQSRGEGVTYVGLGRHRRACSGASYGTCTGGDGESRRIHDRFAGCKAGAERAREGVTGTSGVDSVHGSRWWDSPDTSARCLLHERPCSALGDDDRSTTVTFCQAGDRGEI